jgi:hypothetical protein
VHLDLRKTQDTKKVAPFGKASAMTGSNEPGVLVASSTALKAETPMQNTKMMFTTSHFQYRDCTTECKAVTVIKAWPFRVMIPISVGT